MSRISTYRVYLPTLSGLRGKGPQEWTAFLEHEASSLGIPFINLFSDFRSLPYHEMVRLFIPEGQLSYPGAAGHFNEAGNEFVARVIHDKLKGIPTNTSTPVLLWKDDKLSLTGPTPCFFHFNAG